MIWRGRYSALWGCSQNPLPLYAFAAGETPTPSWIDFLFSFEGRISRKSFWVSGLAIAGVGFLVLAGLGAVLGMDAFGPQKEAMSNTLVNLYNVATIPFYWPIAALYLKRLHDFGEGKGWLFWSLVIVIVLAYGLSFAGFIDGARLLILVSTGIFLIVGCIKGTPGPNQYGPDPLANPPKKCDVARTARSSSGTNYQIGGGADVRFGS